MKIGSKFLTINANESFYYFLSDIKIFMYLYPRIVTDIESFPRYTGLAKDRSRVGFISGETDLSGISYNNGPFYFHLGRGRESFGAGEDVQLVLSHNAPSYDYFKFMYRQNKFRYIFFMDSWNI